MKQTDDTQVLIVSITPSEREAAKQIARSAGMTFKGWLGLLVKRELRNQSGPEIETPTFSSTGARDGAL